MVYTFVFFFSLHIYFIIKDQQLRLGAVWVLRKIVCYDACVRILRKFCLV